MNVQDVLPRDAIPSIDDPAFGPDYFGDPDDEVVVIDGDTPRAYPIRILSYHEVVNDTFEGTPVAVTWCPICWSAVVYERVVGGRTLTFGVSGKLADDTLVLYDRETESEWKQSSGECIAGEFTDERLTTLPGPIVSYERFRADHPSGAVLQPVRADGGQAAREVYDMTPYEAYFEAADFGLREMRGSGPERHWDRTDLDAKAVVLGIERDVDAVGYPRERVAAGGGVVTDTVGNTEVVVFVADGIHAFENPGLDFESTPDGFRADGATWDGTTGESDDGRRLDRIPARRLFAFTWQDDHGPDAFFERS